MPPFPEAGWIWIPRTHAGLPGRVSRRRARSTSRGQGLPSPPSESAVSAVSAAAKPEAGRGSPDRGERGHPAVCVGFVMYGAGSSRRTRGREDALLALDAMARA